MTNSIQKLDDTKEFLENLIQSGKLPKHVKTAEDAFTISQMGRELGFATMQSFHYIIPIQGKLSLNATAINALLRKGGVQFKTTEDAVYVYEDETTSTVKLPDKTPVDVRTTITFYRGDVEEVTSFTWSEAKKMGLVTKDNWVKMPSAMLYARCLAKGARRVGADLLLGLYSTDEMMDHLDTSNLHAVRDEDGQVVEVEELK